MIAEQTSGLAYGQGTIIIFMDIPCIALSMHIALLSIVKKLALSHHASLLFKHLINLSLGFYNSAVHSYYDSKQPSSYISLLSVHLAPLRKTVSSFFEIILEKYLFFVL